MEKDRLGREENSIYDSETPAMEIFRELKEQNKRLAEVLRISIFTFVTAVVLIVAGFLFYLYQYDFSATIEQTGIYTLVDSQGNVISSDITPEQIERILEIINGENKDNENQN